MNRDELKAALDKAMEKELEMFTRWVAVTDLEHHARKEQQPDAIMDFLNRMNIVAYEAWKESQTAREIATRAFLSFSQQPQQIESAAAPRKPRMTKTEQLQAAIDDASKTCLPLQGAKVEYKNGQGFYIRHGGKVLGFVHNFKRGMFLVQEWQKTGRINYAELRAR